jgi:hypothetical protein
VSLDIIKSRFGRFRKAIKQAGFKYNTKSKNKYSEISEVKKLVSNIDVNNKKEFGGSWLLVTCIFRK